MKSKEEVIKDAWIEIVGVDNFKKLTIDENGFEDHYTYSIKTFAFKEHTEKHFDIDNTTGLIRPKSLQGIENNNGWISINSESDLPSEKGAYWVACRNHIYENPRTDEEIAFDYKVDSTFYSHYQSINKPLPPLHK